MKIVIIAGRIKPTISPRAIRATEIAIEMSRQGHEVVLYAILGKYAYSEFEKDHNLKVKNIGKMWYLTLNSDGTSKRKFFNRVLSKLFHRLIEFPDIELMFKIPRVLKNVGQVDLLITIAAPYPIHWGTALFKSLYTQKFPHVWIADCGDPFMGNKFYKKLFYFKYVEKWFCNKADFLTVPIEGAKAAYYEEFNSKIRVIPQGFNFNEVKIEQTMPDNLVPTFIYAGEFYKGIRNPHMFLEYLITLQKEFKFIIYTKDRSLIAPFLTELKEKLEVKDYLPRDKLLAVMSRADFLINFENTTTTQSPSKLIDYSLAGRPILSINTKFLCKETIDEFLNGIYDNQFIVENMEKYDIENVAKNFIKLAQF